MRNNSNCNKKDLMFEWTRARTTATTTTTTTTQMGNMGNGWWAGIWCDALFSADEATSGMFRCQLRGRCRRRCWGSASFELLITISVEMRSVGRNVVTSHRRKVVTSSPDTDTTPRSALKQWLRSWQQVNTFQYRPRKNFSELTLSQYFLNQ